MYAEKYRFASDEHKSWLASNATRQIELFKNALRPEGGFYPLSLDGNPIADAPQEVFNTTRMVHSYALGKLAGASDCDDMIDHGISYIWNSHRDTQYGGYFGSLANNEPADVRKLNYGHVFVLLAASSAKKVGHPDADRLILDITEVLNRRFWEPGVQRFADEFKRDWTPFSNYRGMNSNMHGVEALLNAYEATGNKRYLEQAGKILDFFLRSMAPHEGFRLPEHYTADWTPDWEYLENPMFRPAGTTPGHSFEMARLLLQYWDTIGRPDDGSVKLARDITDRALNDAWDPEKGGFYYTLKRGGAPDIRSRYWWPVTEAIGVLAALLKLQDEPELHEWYQVLWGFCDRHFIDHDRGAWFPELDDHGQPGSHQFTGKPDLYHALQAELFPLLPSIGMKDTSVFSGLLAS